MTTIQIHSHTGPDGLLRLQVPLGKDDGDKDVLVTIQALVEGEEEPKDVSSWHQFVEETYGSCAGLGLKRHEQGEIEQRETIE